MNYYERVEQAIEYIEDNLEGEIDIKDLAKEAYMAIKEFLPDVFRFNRVYSEGVCS